MNHVDPRREVRRATILVLTALLAAGCGAATSSPTGPAAAAAPTTAASPGHPSPTSAPAPSAAARSPAATPSPMPSFMPPTVATFAPAGGGAAIWNLVALGDSNVSGWGIRTDEPYSPQAAFPGVYAGLLGPEQGVTVVLHSYFPSQTGNELRTVAEWADVVASDRSMRADLASARVVILLIGYHDVTPALMFGDCPSDWPALQACLKKFTAPMPAAFDRLYAEVAGLVPKGTTVLALDYGIPGPIYDRWSSKPYWPEFKRAAFEDWRDALEAAAVGHGFTVVHTYAAVNDANGKPKWDWNAVTSDGWHYNAEGHRRIAQIVLAQDGLAAN
jgi:lysophospholipase L1-like esterase